MSFNALTSTIYISLDGDCVCCVILNTDRYRCIALHTTYLTATIDSAFNQSITDYYIRTAFTTINYSYHGFRTGESISTCFFCNTFATAKYISSNGSFFASRCDGLSLAREVEPFARTNLHRCVALYITLVSSTIDGADSTEGKNGFTVFYLLNSV